MASNRIAAAACGPGRPGQDNCRLRTAAPNHSWSIPNDLEVAYSTRIAQASTPTTTAKPRPTHTRLRAGSPDCMRIDSPSVATHNAVHGVIGGQVRKTRVNASIPVAQPTQSNAATTKTAPAAASPTFRCTSAPGPCIARPSARQCR